RSEVRAPREALANPAALVAAGAEVTLLHPAVDVAARDHGEAVGVLAADVDPLADAERKSPAPLALQHLLIEIGLEHDARLAGRHGVERRIQVPLDQISVQHLQ